MDGVVLAVHRKNRDAAPAGGFRHDSARHHQHFLVRERDRLSVFDRRKDRFQPVRAGRRAEDDVHVGCGRDRNQPVAARSRQHGAFHSGGAKPVEGLARRHRDNVRPVSRDLLGEQSGVLTGREAHHGQAIAMGVHNGQRAASDGAGGIRGSRCASLVARGSWLVARARHLSARCSTRAPRKAARRCGRARRRGRE